MKQDEVKKIISKKIEDIIEFGDRVGDSFEEIDIIRFKDEVKWLREFMSFVRTHKGERGMRMGDKCKYVYQISGAMKEAYAMLAANANTTEQGHWERSLQRAKNEWTDNYNSNHFRKLGKQLLDYDYSTIPGEFMRNFFNFHTADLASF